MGSDESHFDVWLIFGALKTGSDESHFDVWLIFEEQSHKTVPTNNSVFEEKVEPKRHRTRGPSAYQLTLALPLGRTGSPLFPLVRRAGFPPPWFDFEPCHNTPTLAETLRPHCNVVRSCSYVQGNRRSRTTPNKQKMRGLAKHRYYPPHSYIVNERYNSRNKRASQQKKQWMARTGN